jgi:Transport and Golgi organisation 2
MVSVGGLMCTVSFLPKLQGFYLAMNRDEKRNRFPALAPAVVKSGSRRAVFPREPTGGTWISVNDAGVCLALINWHRVEREPENDLGSRGLVVRELAGKSTANEIAAALRKLPLRKLRPFRLIAIVPLEERVIEYRWNVERLAICDREWQRQHWFSSGFDEPRAELERAKICSSFVAGGDDPGSEAMPAGVDAAGYSLRWLRELHRSHAPERGPFSICMHRPDAATVSYTEIAVFKQRATMRYKSGASCSNGANVTRTISLALFL